MYFGETKKKKALSQSLAISFIGTIMMQSVLKPYKGLFAPLIVVKKKKQTKIQSVPQ